MAQKEVIRWGVIGCGDVVETINGPGLYLAAGSELVGIWNRTKQKAVDWCERHGHGRAFDSLNELLNCPDIDIVYVATKSMLLPLPRRARIAISKSLLRFHGTRRKR